MWAHNGMLELAQEKMSKSVGNIVSLHDALERWGREPLLLLFLGAHYRQPVEFSEDAMEQARAQWESFRTAHRVVEERSGGPGWEDLAAALDDDFNTPKALAIMHEWRAAGQRDLLGRALAVFGLSPPRDRVLAAEPGEFAVTGSDAALSVGNPPEDIRALADQRQRARAARDFTEADRLRDEIEAAGWEVQDVAEGFRLIPRS
jgi:cysteinyl-tRNA synthetase